jgi:hypothetical protein
MTWISSSRSSGALNPLTIAFSSNFKHLNENSGETNRRLYVERGHVLERLPGVTISSPSALKTGKNSPKAS